MNYYNELASRRSLEIAHFLTFYESIKIDGLVKSLQGVTPAKAGVHKQLIFLDSCSPIGVEDKLHGNDNNGCFLTFYEFIKVVKEKIFRCELHA